nr:MAG TPA: hypothetical protein [Caudoviricetes sp.]
MSNIEKKMEALKANFLEKLEALEKEAEMQKKQEEPKPWKPEARAEYFFIDNYFLSHSFYNMNDDVDSYNFEIGNCFPTKERAEQVAKKMRLLLRLEQLHDMLCPDYVPDYEDEDEVKYHVYFNHLQGEYNISCSTSRENPCVVAFDTKENVEKAAEILNKEMRESK